MLELANGVAPFDRWVDSLSYVLQKAVDARLTRVADGNFGDHKSIGDGVFELRIPQGPVLRIYYGLSGKDIVVLVGGGNKNSQKRDVAKAKELWRHYENKN